jgi:hypothetical protein
MGILERKVERGLHDTAQKCSAGTLFSTRRDVLCSPAVHDPPRVESERRGARRRPTRLRVTRLAVGRIRRRRLDSPQWSAREDETLIIESGHEHRRALVHFAEDVLYDDDSAWSHNFRAGQRALVRTLGDLDVIEEQLRGGASSHLCKVRNDFPPRYARSRSDA